MCFFFVKIKIAQKLLNKIWKKQRNSRYVRLPFSSIIIHLSFYNEINIITPKNKNENLNKYLRDLIVNS